MARSTFGGTAADVVIARGPGGIARLVPATLTFWTAETGGTQVTDLLLDGSPATAISVPIDGQVPAFQGPDGVGELWADGGGGRIRIVAEGKRGLPGVNAVPTVEAVAEYVSDTDPNPLKTALSASNARSIANDEEFEGTPREAVEVVAAEVAAPVADARVPKVVASIRPAVINRKNLLRFSEALKAKACPVITVIGNSIAWGVGSDGLSPTIDGYAGAYRQYAWPVQLRKRLAMQRGQLPTENFIILDTRAGYATLGGTAALSQTIGPFGGFGVNRGGVSLPDSTATVTIDSAKTGRFTDLDVFYWGTTSGVSGGFSPNILIDGTPVYTGGVAGTGRLHVATVTGLTDAAHTITVAGTGSNPTWIAGVLPRRSSGIVVNRIAVPGAKATDVLGSTSWDSTQRQRQAHAAVLYGYSDLVIISMTANELYAQQSLTEYQAALTTLVNAAIGGGACVLLMGDPAIPNEESQTIKGSQYRQVMIDLSNGNGNVAYADFNAAAFGDRAVAQATGLWVASGSVHPSHEGHRRMADFLLNDVLPGAVI